MMQSKNLHELTNCVLELNCPYFLPLSRVYDIVTGSPLDCTKLQSMFCSANAKREIKYFFICSSIFLFIVLKDIYS